MNNEHLGPADLQVFLKTHGIRGEILYLSVPTPTVETAARAVGTQPENILKSILFLVDGEPLLAITNGLAMIDRRKLADLYQVGKKKVKLAPADFVLQYTGYEVGAMPPFGHRHVLPTLLDKRVMTLGEVYAGGGAENALMKLSPQEVLRTTNARLIDLVVSLEEAGEKTG